MVKASDLLTIENVSFADEIDIAVQDLGGVDLVHTSGTLQYVKDPRDFLKRLLTLQAPYIFFGRTAFNDCDNDIIGIQRSKISDHGIQLENYPSPEGFVEYPFIYMPKNEFERALKLAGYTLLTKFDSISGMRPINNHKIIGGAFFYKLTS
jgi:putative methyltransferase (TIGR04325 family)